jgi:hypothetical protein
LKVPETHSLKHFHQIFENLGFKQVTVGHFDSTLFKESLIINDVYFIANAKKSYFTMMSLS